MSIARLQAFLAEIDSDSFQPSQTEIGELGECLVLAARQPDGYADLAWQAGTYLLVLASDHSSLGMEWFFANYGYRAIAASLRATCENHDFPLGLSFIAHQFLPADGLHGLTRIPEIRNICSTTLSEPAIVGSQGFSNLSGPLKVAVAQFLDISPDFGLASQSRLRYAAALLEHTPADQPERHVALHTFLHALADAGQDINLYYSWRAAVEEYPALGHDPSFSPSIESVLRRARACGSETPNILARVLDDGSVLSLASRDARLGIVLGLTGWWLQVHHGRGEGLDLAWQMIEGLRMAYPALGKALSSYLAGDVESSMPLDEVQKLRDELALTSQEIKERLRIRINRYRGVPLAVQIQRKNLQDIFEPLYEALDNGVVSEDLERQIAELDAHALLDRHPLQKASLFPIVGEMRLQMIKDYADLIHGFQRMFELRRRLASSDATRPSHRVDFADSSVAHDLKALLERYPDLSELISWALTPESLASEVA